jgi:glycosyltransferase involved in cell wall biosynthesis
MDYILKRKYSEIEISVFTPLFKTGEKLKRTYQSLKNQTYTEWEWVLISDSSDQRTLQIARSIAAKDPRVKVYQIEPFSNSTIGESKYRACALSNGKHLLELDHDDYLLPHAIEETLKAFKNFPDVGFVYSDCAEIDEQWRSLTYGESFSFGYGSYREEVHLGRKFQVADCANINPITIRHIVGVPNHLRAWKREVYFEVGGHNRKLRIADDYELILRTFLKTKMLKIAKCCYLQFQNGENSQNASRKDIQRRVRTIAFHYNEKIRARFEELGKIDWAYRPDGNFSNLEKPLNEEHVNYTS